MGDYWQLTIDILQSSDNPIVDKPKLQEKYLTKPPFRFLHDVITAVQSNTGFAPGLYSGDELDAKAIQDKDAKVNYLAKIINVVGLVLNETVPAKPVKIVAGLEPENTNVFLQMLGSACRVSNGADAVKRVLGGGAPEAARAAAPPAEAAAAAAAARPSSRPSSQQVLQEQEQANAMPSEPTSTKKRSQSKEDKKDAAAAAATASPAAAPRSSKKPSAAAEDATTPTKPSKSSRSKPAQDEGPATPPPSAPASEPPARAASPAPAAAASFGLGATTPTQEPTAQQQPMIRPQSARKAPPKLPSPAPATGSPAAAGSPARGGAAGRRPTGTGDGRTVVGSVLPSARPITVVEEGAGNGSDNDDDVEVVHQAAPVAIGMGRDQGGGGGEQGVLVKNILDSEKELKRAGEDAAAGGADERGGGGTGIILKRLGKPTAAAQGAGAAGGAVRTQDTATIKDMVQKLCQSSHPLAKSMDYLQEDLENMGKELRFWQTEKRMFADKLSAEQRLVADTSGSGSAAEAQLADLDGQIKQVRDRILGVKAQILRNDETISKLLGMAVGR